jgi:hypothetical protein
LRFRIPKDRASDTGAFYQNEYSEGSVTECPSEDVLSSWIAKKFVGTYRDFTPYISVLKSLGLGDCDSLLDFGASWGYGSWQFREAGFKVFSYEISKPRAQFARDRLSCNMVESIDGITEKVKCLFSAHVIEHLPNPNLLFEIADKVLTADGFMVCFCPNGEPARESLVGVRQYDYFWGKVHPMLITPKFLHSTSARFGFRSLVYSSPYDINDISNERTEIEVTGVEICLIARKA